MARHHLRFPAGPYALVIHPLKGTLGYDSNTGSLWFKAPCDSQEGITSQFHRGTWAPDIFIAIRLPRLPKPRRRNTVSQTGSPRRMSVYFLFALKRSIASMNPVITTLNPRAQLRYSTKPPRYKWPMRPLPGTSAPIRLASPALGNYFCVSPCSRSRPNRAW